MGLNSYQAHRNLGAVDYQVYLTGEDGNAVRAARLERQTIQKGITGLTVVEQNFITALTGIEGTGLMLLKR